jgi:hypothetical protein
MFPSSALEACAHRPLAICQLPIRNPHLQSLLFAPAICYLLFIFIDKYQSIVFLSPSRKSVLAVKPKSSRARPTSRQRLGWPLGLAVSHTTTPLNPINSAISRTRSAIEISLPKKSAGVCPIGADSADSGRQVDHDVGTSVSVEPFGGFDLDEIVFPAPRYEDISTASFLKFLDDEGTEESSATGYGNPLASPKCHPFSLL